MVTQHTAAHWQATQEADNQKLSHHGFNFIITIADLWVFGEKQITDYAKTICSGQVLFCWHTRQHRYGSPSLFMWWYFDLRHRLCRQLNSISTYSSFGVACHFFFALRPPCFRTLSHLDHKSHNFKSLSVTSTSANRCSSQLQLSKYSTLSDWLAPGRALVALVNSSDACTMSITRGGACTVHLLRHKISKISILTDNAFHSIQLFLTRKRTFSPLPPPTHTHTLHAHHIHTLVFFFALWLLLSPYRLCLPFIWHFLITVTHTHTHTHTHGHARAHVTLLYGNQWLSMIPTALLEAEYYQKRYDEHHSSIFNIVEKQWPKLLGSLPILRVCMNKVWVKPKKKKNRWSAKNHWFRTIAFVDRRQRRHTGIVQFWLYVGILFWGTQVKSTLCYEQWCVFYLTFSANSFGL